MDFHEFLRKLLVPTRKIVYHRKGAEGVAQMKADSIALLNDFEPKKLEQLNQDYNAQGISPGGSADMLALTIFVNFIIHF